MRTMYARGARMAAAGAMLACAALTMTACGSPASSSSAKLTSSATAARTAAKVYLAKSQDLRETAFYRPMVSDWRNYETWADDGARTATERANGIWKRLLAESETPPIEPDRAEAIGDFIARRKDEIVGRA